jgi:phosphoadenosine phosphosulfate reductase
MRWGFPKNLVGHSWAYAHLKERALRIAWKELPPTEKMFASGVRSKESKRRKRTVGKGVRKKGGIQIENPIADWSTPQVWAYLRKRGLSVSPAYLSLGRSGDCLCGAFSREEEAAIVMRTYPEVARRITALEDRAATKFAFPKCRWGSDRSIGGFSKLRGRLTLEEAICGGDCTLAEER